MIPAAVGIFAEADTPAPTKIEHDPDALIASTISKIET